MKKRMRKGYILTSHGETWLTTDPTDVAYALARSPWHVEVTPTPIAVYS